MSKLEKDPLLRPETTCGSLLDELKIIWDEVGETDDDRDRMLLELEQECLEVYRRKVDHANRFRAQLRQQIADSEAELAAICSAMGERPVHIRQSDQDAGSLNIELSRILPELNEMRKRKSDRRNQFLEVHEQIKTISNEIYTSQEQNSAKIVMDENDLSLRKLEELNKQFHALQKEKGNRLKTIQDHLLTLNALCFVLGMDSVHTASEIHPSLGQPEGSKSISSETIEHLAATIQKLREVKIQRMQKLQDIATSMLELWNLMDTPLEEQQEFQNVTCNVAASEHEITEPNTLSEDYITYAEAEVSRLEELKKSKMKELVLRKRSELEEICRKTHLIPEVETVDCAIEAIASGIVDPASLLQQIEHQIGHVKGEAFSRKEILEKVEKWLGACDEENWLEEYNRDDNRYNAGRGAHLTLKRAEKARALVNKLPGMAEALTSRTVAWENERGIEFTYDGVRLLSLLEDYNIARQEKEQERRRLRDQKKLQGQMIAEQETLYGSKPTPSKLQSIKKTPRISTGGASSRRVSVGGLMVQTPRGNSQTPRKGDKTQQNDGLYDLDDSISVLSAARRGLDVVGIRVKKHTFEAANMNETDSSLMRQPFSPISSSASSKSNMANLSNGLNVVHSEKMLETHASNNMLFTTPFKTATVIDEENRTPKTIPVLPTTPSTLSVPMNTAITPAPKAVPFSCDCLIQEIPEENEYSFEEIRAGFVLPKTHLKSVILI